MFRAHVLIIRRSKLHYTASGIITPIGGTSGRSVRMSVLSHSSTNSAFTLISSVLSQILTQAFLLTYCNKSKYPLSCFEGLICYTTRYFCCYKKVWWYHVVYMYAWYSLCCLVLRFMIIMHLICVWSYTFRLFLCLVSLMLLIHVLWYVYTNPYVWRYLGCLTYFYKLFLSYLIIYENSQ